LVGVAPTGYHRGMTQPFSYPQSQGRAAISQRRMCHFSGRVQGVGFRYTVKNIALQYNVRGYVRNLSDGRVELVMEGPENEMDSIVESVRQKMSDYINNVQYSTSPATGEFEQFCIKH
jgi:acylphosphatase